MVVVTAATGVEGGSAQQRGARKNGYAVVMGQGSGCYTRRNYEDGATVLYAGIVDGRGIWAWW